MKGNLAVVLVVVMVGVLLLFGMKVNGGKATPAEKPAIVESSPAVRGEPATVDEREASLRAAIIAKYGDKIEWLAFSEAEFAEERDILRKHYAESFEKNEAASKQRIRIQIAKADLNGDGRPDMVWKILHPFYRGASTSATLGISYYDGDKLKHVMHFPIQWGPIGLRPSETSQWKEMVMYDKLYSWDGKWYGFVEEPLETLAEEKYFRVTRDKDRRYTVTVFDEEKNVVTKFRDIKEPRVTMVNADILRASVRYNAGTEPRCEYYDRKNKRMSRTYDNVLAERGDRVLYVDGNRLIIRNMFDQNTYYKEVVREYLTSPGSGNSIVKVLWEEPARIVVQHLEGVERRLVSEEILLD